MIITRELNAKPADADIHQSIFGISRLMERLIDKDVYYLGIYHYKEDTYITIKGHGRHGSSISFVVVRRYIWKWVAHMISISPYDCDCWMCKWRRINLRYHNPTFQFNHLGSDRFIL